ADEIAAAAPDGPGDLRLLPAYDNYLVGWRDRTLSVPPGRERAVWPGGGQIRPTVVVDGHAAGTWRRTGAAVEVSRFEELPEPLREPADAEAADVVRFLTGCPVRRGARAGASTRPPGPLGLSDYSVALLPGTSASPPSRGSSSSVSSSA